jgi:hypothetical protein
MNKQMSAASSNDRQDRLIAELTRLWKDEQDQLLIANSIRALNTRYDLGRKIAHEPGVEDIIKQMVGRLAGSYGRLSDVQNKRILDIACGSNTSKLPASFFLSTLFGGRSVVPNQGYTALFEPWFCRLLFELEATPVGIDFGDLEQEVFIHYQVDLGKTGALDFLPAHSFDAIQDSRLFGSPEFTAQFRNPADHLKVAQEIKRQEQRLLKIDGIIIHSDAAAMLK